MGRITPCMTAAGRGRRAIRALLPRFAGDAAGRGDRHERGLADKPTLWSGFTASAWYRPATRTLRLRRAALGVIRMLVENTGRFRRSVLELLQLARSQFATGVLAESVAQDPHGFVRTAQTVFASAAFCRMRSTRC